MQKITHYEGWFESEFEKFSKVLHKQTQTSFFEVLITELCRRARVLRDVKKDMEVIPTFFTNIRRIEVEYFKDERKIKEVGSPGRPFLGVDTDSPPTKVFFPTLSHGPTCISISIPFGTLGS